MNGKALSLPQTTQTTTREHTPRYMLLQGVMLIAGMLGIALIHYNAPASVSVIIQLAFLALFFRSIVNYPWLFIMMFVSFRPGGIFSPIAKPFVLIESSAFGILSFEMMFVLVAWLKVLKTKLAPVFYQRRFIIVIMYILLLVIVFGTRPVSLIRTMIFFSWLLVVPRLLNTQKEIDRLFYIIFLANAFAFLTNIYKVAFASPVLSLLTPDFTLRRALDPEALIRTAEAIQFAHLSVVGGLYYLSMEHSPISSLLAYSGLVLGFINIVSSATRGWIIGTILLIFLYSFFMLPRLFRNIMIVIPVVAITITLLWNIAIIRTQLTKAYDRILYYENIARPDLNEDTTDIGRVRRGARVMDKYYESPWVGFGFSEEARDYIDSHTGNQSILLNMGLIGYLLMLNLWIWFVFKLISSDNILRPRNPEYKHRVLVVLAFLSVFFIHSTSGAFLHPTIGASTTIWYGMVFALGNYLYLKDKHVLT